MLVMLHLHSLLEINRAVLSHNCEERSKPSVQVVAGLIARTGLP